MVPAVVRALTAARTIGWSLWWSPGFWRATGVRLLQGAAWETVLGPSSRQSTEALRSLSFLVAAGVVRTWNPVHFLCVLVLPVEYSIGFSGDSFSHSCATLGSTVDTCFASVLWRLWTNLHTFSTMRQTRILKCCSPFCCRTEKRAQSMLLVTVLLCAVRTWKTAHNFYELHVAETRDDGWPFFFRRSMQAFFGLLFGVEARRFRVCQFIPATC